MYAYPMIVPHYDEFGIYTTEDEIKSYIESLIKEGEIGEEEVLEKCKKIFGEYSIDIIEYIVYGD